MIRANHKDTKWRGEIIKKGEFLTSYDKLSSGTGLTIQNVRTSIKNLESTGELTRQSTSKLTKLTICNYVTYNDSELSTNKLTNKPVTNEQQTSNKQLTTDKNEKNLKKEKKFIVPSLEEVKIYFVGKGFTEQSAIKAFNYYDVANWFDSKGNKIKNWRQKMQGVWFKDENSIHQLAPKPIDTNRMLG